MRTLPMGLAAVLVQDPDGGPARWSEGLRALAVPGVVEVVPAARTVLVTCATASALEAAVARFGDVRTAGAGVSAPESVTIEVSYDGEDLDAVAQAAELTVPEVVELHAAATFTVEFCGFAPGFAYMTGLPAALHLPRRASPRERVPAGAVAIAAEYSAVYPRVSPGGWHLIGSTNATLFDPRREPPALLRPGMHVSFERSG